jgi:hypothetical protein
VQAALRGLLNNKQRGKEEEVDAREALESRRPARPTGPTPALLECKELAVVLAVVLDTFLALIYYNC